MKTHEYLIHILILILLSTSLPILIVFMILAMQNGLEQTWMRAFKFLNDLVEEIDKKG